MSISVVIPAYNAERTIRAALDSVLAQTVLPDEVLVVDDESKDSTREIVASYPAPVRLLTQTNGGPSKARNNGVAQSSSEFIAFLDSDDAWEPRKLELQLKAFERVPKAVLCYTGLVVVDTDGNFVENTTGEPERNLPTRLKLGNPGLTPTCVMLRREAFVETGGFLLTLRGSEDWELWVRLFELGPFCAVPEPLARYTTSNTGLSSDADHMFHEAKYVVEHYLLERLSPFQRMVWRRKILGFQCMSAGYTARAAKEYDKEMKYMLQSFLLWPNPFWQPRRLKALLVTLKQAAQRKLGR